MKKRKPKAPGKPRNRYRLGSYSVLIADNMTAEVHFARMTPRQARELSVWLTQYADWADAQAARRKGSK